MLRRIDAVVPVHDEEALVGACLDALLVAREAVLRTRPTLEVGIVVVLDDCSDDSARIVMDRLAVLGARDGTGDGVGDGASGSESSSEASSEGASIQTAVVVIEARSVGAARAAGVATAAAFGSFRDDERWFANTDADSQVPEDWFSVHADAADAGIDILLGTVRPDFDDFSADDVRRWSETHPAGHLPGNVHGANLGVRADRLRELGGFSDVPEHEDADLVERARAAGLRVVPTADGVVETSGRRRGRTPGGYAAFLAETYPR